MNEKSSAPIVGSTAASTFPAPTTSRITSAAKRVSSPLLIVGG
jgi:hypothetical protein